MPNSFQPKHIAKRVSKSQNVWYLHILLKKILGLEGAKNSLKNAFKRFVKHLLNALNFDCFRPSRFLSHVHNFASTFSRRWHSATFKKDLILTRRTRNMNQSKKLWNSFIFRKVKIWKRNFHLILWHGFPIFSNCVFCQ